jgi:hypothetical protein
VDDIAAQDDAPTAPAAEVQSTAASAAAKPRFTRRFLLLAVAAISLALAILGGTWLVATGGALLPFSDESVVRRYVLDNADDPASVEFDRWGPNDEEGRVAGAIEKRFQERGLTGFGLAMQQMGFPPGSHTIRVRFRAKNRVGAKELVDMLYAVKDGKVVGTQINPFGDDWIEKMLGMWGLPKS